MASNQTNYEGVEMTKEIISQYDLNNQQVLKEWLHYEEISGRFYWLKSAKYHNNKFKTAGGIATHGYVQISFKGKRYYAHRLAFVFMTGRLPIGDVDHKNKNKSDNKWSNLRDVTRTINQQNRKSYNVIKKSDGFVATIRANNRTYYSPLYTTDIEAHAAYLAMKKIFHLGYVE